MILVALSTLKRTIDFCSHHVGAFFGPGESERRVSRPFAVQSYVRVHIYSNWSWLHYQYWAN